MTIIVNGKARIWGEDFASYDQIVACEFPSPPGPATVVTVTFKGTDRSGVLMPGASVRVEQGMVFQAQITGSA